MILRHIIGLAIALVFTWMLFFGANYFRVVWTHYFSDEPPKSTGEVSAKIIDLKPDIGPPPYDCRKTKDCKLVKPSAKPHG